MWERSKREILLFIGFAQNLSSTERRHSGASLDPWHASHVPISNGDEIAFIAAGRFAEDISSASYLPPEPASLPGPVEEDA